MPSFTFPDSGEAVERIIDALEIRGWVAVDHYLSDTHWQALRLECEAAARSEMLKPAAIGHAAARTIDPLQRSDRIAWLDSRSQSQAVEGYYRRMEGLREALNRNLQLGLFEYECHFSHYPIGGFYRRHLDQFQGSSLRQVSSILYLNPEWQRSDGGALRVYSDTVGSVPFWDILPQGGRLVLFLSARFEHEVLPAYRPRSSLTGWFRRRA